MSYEAINALDVIPAQLMEEGADWSKDGSIENAHITAALTGFKQLVEAQHAERNNEWYSRLATVAPDEKALSGLFPMTLPEVDREVRELVPSASNIIFKEHIGQDNSKQVYRYSVYEVLHILRVTDANYVSKMPRLSAVYESQQDMKTANVARAGSAAGSINSTIVEGGAPSGPPQPSAVGGFTGRLMALPRPGGSANLWVIIDVFLTLIQKLGLWIANVVPNLSIPLPMIAVTFSWFRGFSLGWELFFRLPDLSKRGYLFWIMLLFALSAPFYLSLVIYLDNGKVPAHCDASSASSVIDWANRGEFRTGVGALLLGVVLIVSGAAIANSELLGFGMVSFFFGVALYLWTRIKSLIFEQQLARNNRKPVPAYRGMRVVVCSKIFLIVLRSMYIMTISALSKIIMGARGDSSRDGETAVASLFMAPAVVLFPLTIYFEGAKFNRTYILPQRIDMDQKSFLEYRGWLERFAVREHSASMLDATMAELLLPFQPDRWFYATIQLAERAFATIFATFLVDDSSAQLGLALTVEVSASLAELFLTPFTEKTEDNFNLAWRVIAGLILLILMLVEVIGKPFAAAGDWLLVLLVFVSLFLFLFAIDIPKLVRAAKLNAAVKKFRDYELDYRDSRKPTHEVATFGDLGIEDIPGPEELSLGTNLRAALAEIPPIFDAGEILRDALSYVQQYRILVRADNDVEALKQVLLSRAMWYVDPLVTLHGSKFGGSIPSCIGAYGNVRKLILSDMALDDSCSLAPLRAMTRLEFLDLDGNDFRERISGLESLTFEKFSLSVANLKKWTGKGNSAFIDALDKGKHAQYFKLSLAGSEGFASSEAPISWKFVQFVKAVTSFTSVQGKAIGEYERKYDNREDITNPREAMTEESYDKEWEGSPPSETVDRFEVRMREKYVGYFDELGFQPKQFRLGGIDLKKLKEMGLWQAAKCQAAGYSLTEIRVAGYTVTDVKDLGEFGLISARELREAGYSVQEVFGARTDLDEFELERGGFPYKDMVLRAAIQISEPPLSVSMIKLRECGELNTFNADELAACGYEYDDFTSSNSEDYCSITKEEFREAITRRRRNNIR